MSNPQTGGWHARKGSAGALRQFHLRDRQTRVISSNWGRSATWRWTALTTVSPTASAPGPAAVIGLAEGRVADSFAGARSSRR